MKNESPRRTYLIFGSVLTLLVLLNVIGIAWHLLPNKPEKWNDNIFAGRVVSVGDGKFLTVDPRNKQMEFSIDTQIISILPRVSVSSGPSVQGMQSIEDSARNITAKLHTPHDNEPGRNDVCPCGSGKKWKKCGMLNTPEHQEKISKQV